MLLGAVGGPKWSDPTAELRPEQGLLDLRAEMGLFANPIGAILSAAMLLRHSLDLEAEAAQVEAAVAAVLDEGFRTADLVPAGQQAVSTTEMGTAVAEKLQAS